MIDYSQLRKWYGSLSVLYEMFPYLKKREFALLVPSFLGNHKVYKTSTRMLKCNNVQQIKYNLERLKWGERNLPYNFYYSLAKYGDGIPVQSFNYAQRKENNKNWTAEHWKHITGYDYLIDVDSPDQENIAHAHQSARMLKNFFNQLNVPYEFRFSGCGFHFVIPSMYLPELSFNPHKEHNIYKFLSKVSKKLLERFSEMIDVNIYDSRRLCKIPYSLAIYEQGNYVCHPFLDKGEFDNFYLNDLDPLIYPMKYNLLRRGGHVFNRDGNFENLYNYIGVDANGKKT